MPYEGVDLARFGTANHLLISVVHNSAGVGLQFAKSANLERGNDTKKPTLSKYLQTNIVLAEFLREKMKEFKMQ